MSIPLRKADTISSVWHLHSALEHSYVNVQQSGMLFKSCKPIQSQEGNAFKYLGLCTQQSEIKYRACKQVQVYSDLWPTLHHSFAEKQNSLQREPNSNHLKRSCDTACVIAMARKLSNPLNSMHSLCRWVIESLRHRSAGTVEVKQHHGVGTEASRNCEHTWIWGHHLAKCYFLIPLKPWEH